MSRFYILRIHTMTEDPDAPMPEGEDEPPLTVPEETLVFYQDRAEDAATNDAEVMERFVQDMDGVMLCMDKAALLGCVTDPLVLQVLQRWDKICVDFGLQVFNHN